MKETKMDDLNPIDRETLREQVRTAQPYPHFKIDDFFKHDFALEVAEAFPRLEHAQKIGVGYRGINERGKIQISDSSVFPDPIRKVHEILASPEFVDLMSYVMDIPNLLADPQLVGGGIHMTGPRGHLDVHVDFNYLKDRDWHRRLNILVFFNQDWREESGGNFELWDRNVRTCSHSFSPVLNRCLVFATSDISYHGVTAVRCPSGQARKSFAGYYYTREAPAGWDGKSHSTVFKARPNERMKGRVLMPVEKAGSYVKRGVKGFVKAIIGKRMNG